MTYMNGIDVSNWQKGIDLAAVPADFVIMKATEGAGYVSLDCDRQYQQAKKAGRCLGVYHYANGKDYKAEADYFLKNIRGYIGEAILCLDWEARNNSLFNTGKDNAWIKNWCDYVYSKTGVKPLVYIQASALSRVSGIGDYGLWVAQYADMNDTGYQETPWNEGAYTCTIRQYSSSGKLSGYSGALDLNKFYGDATVWKKYANPDGAAFAGSAPSKPGATTVPNGTTLELAVATIQGKYGNGDTRKLKLGNRYTEVQNFINHISSASVDTLVAETKAGKYGNGDTRKIVLGSRYTEVQNKINAGSAQYYVIKSGDTLSGIASKFGTTVAQLQTWNRIANANVIYAGQKIRVK